MLMLLLLLLLTPQAHSADIRLGVHNFPPFFVQHADGSCGGEAVELTRHILQSANITVEVNCASPARIYKMLQRGEIDLTINIKHTKALADAVQFVEPPYGQLSLVLLTHGAAVARDKKPTIAAIRGFDYHGQRQQLTDKGYTFIDMADSIGAVELFVKGRTNALITYEAPFNYYLQQQNLTFATHYQRFVLENLDTHYVISNASKHSALLRQAFEHYAQQHQQSYFSH